MSLSTGSRLGPYRSSASSGPEGWGRCIAHATLACSERLRSRFCRRPRPATSAAEARFEREAKAIASVNHPNICAIHDVGIDGGRRFLVMELLDGETLRPLAGAGAVRPARGAWNTATALADALQAAHARGIIHRDLKPETSS